MVKDDNGPANPYPGPAGADSDDELMSDNGAAGGAQSQDEQPNNPSVDESEEPSPGSSA
ncbi:hypothetical protein [Pseudomonas massiliensis]|uniref:hypothetical protein n=1 Tax=Pseudomonas TaxID=286 RepID=UPI000B31DB6E|nr:hypothetical protein [Pseudomonas massiliensis]